MLCEQISKLLLHFLQFGRDDHLAVALVRIIRIVILVIVLGRIKDRTLLDRRNDRIALVTRRVQFINKCSRFFALLGSGGEYGRAILRTDIITLAIQLCRVMAAEKYGHERAVA